MLFSKSNVLPIDGQPSFCFFAKNRVEKNVYIAYWCTYFIATFPNDRDPRAKEVRGVGGGGVERRRAARQSRCNCISGLAHLRGATGVEHY